MNDHFRLKLIKHFFKLPIIADITYEGLDFPITFKPRQLKKRRLCRRLQRISAHLCPRKQENPAHPASLKAGMSGHKHTFTLVKFHQLPIIHICPHHNIFTSIQFLKTNTPTTP